MGDEAPGSVNVRPVLFAGVAVRQGQAVLPVWAAPAAWAKRRSISTRAHYHTPNARDDICLYFSDALATRFVNSATKLQTINEPKTLAAVMKTSSRLEGLALPRWFISPASSKTRGP